ncbi:uncharacterized protein Dana_GF17231 [Drosophila ananassae]|uniref:Ig-like domain-containing protein n=1 Tax=Drosophila ananassae TaxID=7217 RepID=B3LZN8_DROAN|nr:uncharacterized protein LOC6500016 isoform X1 [Drosophila ananassae]XP_032305356.1 uncharacterized protein LOC6500016 isoform X1 [Drosophila ananassae]EDV41980.1 uncharacterized protein Dana_GF17231 [Drosophila ananassae]
MTGVTLAIGRREAAGQRGCRHLLLTSRPASWLLLLLAAALGCGMQVVTCSPQTSQPPLAAELIRGLEPETTEGHRPTTATRSTLPDRPLTTQNDLITTAGSLTTAKKLPQQPATTEAGATSSLWSTAAARGMPSADMAGTTIATTQSAQIGLTTESTVRQTEAPTAATHAATAAQLAAATSEMLISTIYPPSAETDAHNSIARLPAEAEVEPHPGVADSLTKGFSIPTFLPPFPVFAAADLPAYRAAADAAAEAAAAAEAEAAKAAAASSEAVTISPEEQRRRTYTEQKSYLAANRGVGSEGVGLRRNLTMPVLNLTAQMGNHAYMPCQIHRLSDKPVSWVRIRDNHIISVDETTFIADERFQSIFQEDHDYTWSLQIKYVQPSDAGWYECQMATEPKLSAKVHLQIVTPKTELIGDQSRFVKAGSKVALHCIVRGTLDPPKYIIWFRGQKKISESDERTGWYTQLDRNIFGTVGDNQNTIGSLIIPVVRKEDSGNYTCQPSNSVSVSVDLHVLSGEYSASAIMSAATRTRTRTGEGSTFLAMLGLLGVLGLLRAMQPRT